MARTIGVEQMYTPHQVPWTLTGARDLLRAIAQRAGKPMSLSKDVGHQSGQARFQKPGFAEFHRAVTAIQQSDWQRVPWLGPKTVFDLAIATARTGAEPATAWAEAERQLPACDHLFATPADGDPYAWLAEFAPYSPIIHLQQTDGRHSAHRPFTPAENATGIITPRRVLEEIALGYSRLTPTSLVPPVTDLYLTLEIFFPTAAHPYAALEEIRASVAYWRQAIPADGIELAEALARVTKES